MQLDKLTFRELDQKWIAIDRKKDIKKINKRLKKKFSYEPIIGYIYIDHENGIGIRIGGHVIKENNHYSLEEEVVKEQLKIEYNEKINFHVTILNDDIASAIKGSTQIEIDCQKYYEDQAINDSRKEEILDEFRHEYYPDDLEVLLTTNKDEEFLWTRINAYSPKHKVAVCTLISDSLYNKDYKESLQVFAKIEEDGKNIILKLDKPIKQKEQS